MENRTAAAFTAYCFSFLLKEQKKASICSAIQFIIRLSEKRLSMDILNTVSSEGNSEIKIKNF